AAHGESALLLDHDRFGRRIDGHAGRAEDGRGQPHRRTSTQRRMRANARGSVSTHLSRAMGPGSSAAIRATPRTPLSGRPRADAAADPGRRPGPAPDLALAPGPGPAPGPAPGPGPGPDP